MIDSFIFELNYESKAGRRCRAVCVSLLGQLFGQEHLRDTLQGYLDVENRIPPDVIVLIVLAGDELATSKLCQSQEVLDVIPGFTRSFEPPRLVAIKMDLNGVWSAVTEESGEFSHPEFIEKIKVNGLRRIFEKRGVLLEGNGRFHYSKPDLDHTDKFLRTANALVSWSETAFLALWLLPFLRTDLDAVYTDTAAINSLVLTAVLLRLRHSPNEKPPIVESFGSYAGLRTHSDLRRERSLFVISASTKGGLERELRKSLQIGSNQIVTVFHLGPGAETGVQLILNITAGQSGKKPDVDGWVKPAPSFRPGDCDFCKINIPLVPISGDQFLPITPQCLSEVIRIDHSPRWLPVFLESFAGRGVLRVNKVLAGEQDQEPRELFIDLERVYDGFDGNFDNTPFGRRLKRAILHNIPGSIDHIIYIEDPSSKALAKLLAEKTAGVLPSKVLTPESEKVLPTNFNNHHLGRGTIVVAAGTFVTGQKIMEVNQLLRGRPEDSVVYFAGLSRTRDEERLAEIRSNVQFGQYGAVHFPFIIGFDIFLPDEHFARRSPWERELETWTEFGEQAESLGTVLQLANSEVEMFRTWVEDRKRAIEDARVGGLEDELFLPSLNDQSLSIRDGFAFWRSVRLDLNGQASQADVYFTIAAVLHRWRQQLHSQIGSFTREYARVLLSPRNFYRFNDGVIQACMLRAANAGELDHHFEAALDTAMSEVLNVVFTRPYEPAGEATLEFLLAIAERRLILLRKTVDERTRDLEERLNRNPLDIVARCLCELARRASGQ